MIINIELCGEWGGGGQFYGDCPGKGSCYDYIKNPNHMKEAYFLIDSIDIYDTTPGSNGHSVPVSGPAFGTKPAPAPAPVPAPQPKPAFAPKPAPAPAPAPAPSGECCMQWGACVSDSWCNAEKSRCLGSCNAWWDKSWGSPGGISTSSPTASSSSTTGGWGDWTSSWHVPSLPSWMHWEAYRADANSGSSTGDYIVYGFAPSAWVHSFMELSATLLARKRSIPTCKGVDESEESQQRLRTVSVRLL